LSFQRFADLNAAALDLAKWLTYAESYPTMLRRPIEMVGAFTRAAIACLEATPAEFSRSAAQPRRALVRPEFCLSSKHTHYCRCGKVRTELNHRKIKTNLRRVRDLTCRGKTQSPEFEKKYISFDKNRN
jgi:hypothetical protein